MDTRLLPYSVRGREEGVGGGGRWGRRAFEAMGRGFLIAQVRGFNLGQIDRL